ncbi:ribbon-helix-helix protein, CopG family [Lacrimispora sp. NSJ-141]|uniref:Ribbon-helix-helix protein, CopG family n=1 Tax=Lientehia hominis TaxID=2897778 RepID=A0AAP2RIQ0_9FIRM|nr:ribbon-helix-helix protein, CopG family [Lientehia hominis]MCD2492471.1 ribbon-helix-helix protein, CopG family [Lientehia hominis]
MAKKQDMAAMLDGFEAAAAKEHEAKETKATVGAVDDSRATALVSMTKSDKERLTAIAKAHGLSLSAFFRLAADEYIATHEW